MTLPTLDRQQNDIRVRKKDEGSETRCRAEKTRGTENEKGEFVGMSR